MTDFSRKASINRGTTLCMSLSARPGNFGTRFQNHLYGALDLDYVYKSFTTTDLNAAIGGVRALGIRGCAISMPFKEACIPLLDGLEPSAAAIESVNTIVNTDGVLTGYNTDYIAIERLIEQYALPKDATVVLRGSGGMGKAVASAFHDAGFEKGILIARNERAGRMLADHCHWDWYSDLDLVPPENAADAILVNVTPLGMAGGADAQTLAFPKEWIVKAHCVFDVVAIPVETPLILAARAAGRPTIDGGEVLVLQGLEQFALYTGIRPERALVEEAAAIALA